MRQLRPFLIVALALMLAACGGATSATPAATGAGDPGTTPAETAGAGSTDGPATGEATPAAPATDDPAVETGEPTPAETGSPAVTAAPARTDAASPSVPASGAAACSGSDANRSFFQAAANAVDWPVLCAVLPKGWFVAEGSYRKANGGKVLISYKGPGGATLSLSEGSFCSADDGCVPSGGELGEAGLGTLGGTLVGLDDGGLAIVVDRGLSPSWLLVASGLDQPTVLALGDAMVEVRG